MKGHRLYLRWVAANSLAELLGLGATFALDILLFTRLGDPKSVPAALGMILLTTSTGAVEGAVVGLLQWSVLRGAFPQIARRAWVVATVGGALVAWFFGSLPSTLMGIGSGESSAASQEPETWLMMVLGAAMGLVLGVILALPQWRVLRRAAKHAWVWLPANAVAWALGMPLIFAAVDLAYGSGTVAGAIGVMAAALALTGAVVGAVHGLALVWLAGSVQPMDRQEIGRAAGA
jgi:hypothetical protein